MGTSVPWSAITRAAANNWIFLSKKQRTSKMFSQAKQLIPVVSSQCQTQRGMASLKLISMRLKSVRNTQKIVSAMKMVSSAKFARAEKELKKARPMGEGALAFYEKAE